MYLLFFTNIFMLVEFVIFKENIETHDTAASQIKLCNSIKWATSEPIELLCELLFELMRSK